MKLLYEPSNKMAIFDDNGHATVLTRRPNSKKKPEALSGLRSPMRSFQCDRAGHFSEDCNRPERGGPTQIRR